MALSLRISHFDNICKILRRRALAQGSVSKHAKNRDPVADTTEKSDNTGHHARNVWPWWHLNSMAMHKDYSSNFPTAAPIPL